jgi:FdhD protein
VLHEKQTSDLPLTSATLASVKHGPAGTRQGARAVAEETAIALVYDGIAHAVMMATPSDLEDFALGFSLTEGFVQRAEQLLDVEVVGLDAGIELRISLDEQARTNLRARRRWLAGPVGCGLCGVESIAAAMRQSPWVQSNRTFDERLIGSAVEALESGQALNKLTRATHAAAFFLPGRGLAAVREDVGRHNALDKVAGALARRAVGAADGAIVLTSRVSVEMVHKAAMIGAPLLIAISAPTALAVRAAQAANITLAAVARGNSFEVFTRSDRLREMGGA